MRMLNEQVMSSLDVDFGGASSAIDTSWIMYGSFQAVATGTPSGTLKVQMSNDKPVAYNLMSDFTPTNWTDVSGLTVNVTSATTFLIPKFDVSYQWIRCVFTDTGNGTQTITTVADGSALANVSRVNPVDDVAGSLNNTYFNLYSANNAVHYIVWFNVNSAGTPPAIPSTTNIEVAIPTGEIIANICAAIQSAVDAVGSGLVFTSNYNATQVIIHNLVTGPCTAIAEGLVATGFTFSTAVVGRNAVGLILNNKYFYINDSVADGGVAYYVWLDTGTGVDPMIPAKTGIQVVIAPGASASAVATAVASAVQGAAAIACTPASNVITCVNTSIGPFTPAVDVDTTFVFAVTVSGGTVTVRFKSLGN